MEYEMPICRVNIYLNDNSNLLNSGRGKFKLNEAELKAISISNTIYYNNRYYDIINMAFNFNDSNTLEVFVRE